MKNKISRKAFSCFHLSASQGKHLISSGKRTPCEEITISRLLSKQSTGLFSGLMITACIEKASKHMLSLHLNGPEKSSEYKCTVIDWLWTELFTTVYMLSLCHHIVPVVSLCVSGNKPGREPETQHPLSWGGRLCLSVWPPPPTSTRPLMRTAQNKPTLEQRQTWNVCSDSLSQDVHFLWGCAMCVGWFMFSACEMHYGACRKKSTARFPLQTDSGWVHHTVSLTWYTAAKIRPEKSTHTTCSSWQAVLIWSRIYNLFLNYYYYYEKVKKYPLIWFKSCENEVISRVLVSFCRECLIPQWFQICFISSVWNLEVAWIIKFIFKPPQYEKRCGRKKKLFNGKLNA